MKDQIIIFRSTLCSWLVLAFLLLLAATPAWAGAPFDGVTVGSDGMLYLVEPFQGRVFRLDQSGGNLEQIFEGDDNKSHLFRVAVDASGRVLVGTELDFLAFDQENTLLERPKVAPEEKHLLDHRLLVFDTVSYKLAKDFTTVTRVTSSGMEIPMPLGEGMKRLVGFSAAGEGQVYAWSARTILKAEAWAEFKTIRTWTGGGGCLGVAGLDEGFVVLEHHGSFVRLQRVLGDGVELTLVEIQDEPKVVEKEDEGFTMREDTELDLINIGAATNDDVKDRPKPK